MLQRFMKVLVALADAAAAAADLAAAGAADRAAAVYEGVSCCSCS